MSLQKTFAAALLLTVCGLPHAEAQSTKTTEEVGADGQRYRVTTTTSKRARYETSLEEQERTVYRDRYTSEMRESDRTVLTPVTEYRWQPVLQGRWNPFVQPYVQYQLVPVTRWESRIETVRRPVTRHELVPEKIVEKRPVQTLRWVDVETIERVAIGPAVSPGSNAANLARRDSGSSAANLARRDKVGGIKIESDPPRRATSLR